MRELTGLEIENVAGGIEINWSLIGAGVGLIGLGLAIAATGGLAGVAVGIIAGAGTAGEIIVAGAAVGSAAAGGVAMGSGINP